MSTKQDHETAPSEESEGGGATENKYDRQLRLWQMHGQLALLNARVLVLGSGPVATEFLKNMILPGTGKNGIDLEGNKIDGTICIVDDVVVTKRDLGNNFFVRAGDLGRQRAEAVKRTLHELNPDDTNVNCKIDNVDTLISSNPKFFEGFTLVVGTQLSRKSAIAVDEICRSRGIPLILGKINGLIGYIRNSVKCHEVIESKPGDYVHRLHGRDPWPELIELAKKVCVDASSQKSLGDKLKMHKEVPWILLLVNKIQEKKSNSSDFDVNMICTDYSKRSQLLTELCKDSESFIEPINEQKFQAGLKAGKSEEEMNTAMEACPSLNYSQARAQGSACLRPFALPSSPEFESVMSDDRVKSSSPPKLENDFSGNFWKMARALNRFIQKHKRFPVRKEVPDMEAGNKYYVMLKDCFRRKSEADCKLFREELKLEYGNCMPDDDIIERFCHNAPFVEVFKTRSLKEEESRDLSDDIFELVDDEMYECNGGDMDLHPFKFYLLFRAADSFHEEHGQYPGWTDDTVEEDRKKITSHIAKILSSHQLEEDYLNDNHANEIVRYGGSEIHPVAAFVGGVLAQEATKMITHQFQLLQSTFVYNGLCGSSERFDL